MSATLSTLAGVAGGSLATYWLQRAHDLRRERRERGSSEAADKRASIRAALRTPTSLLASSPSDAHTRSALTHVARGWHTTRASIEHPLGTRRNCTHLSAYNLSLNAIDDEVAALEHDTDGPLTAQQRTKLENA